MMTTSGLAQYPAEDTLQCERQGVYVCGILPCDRNPLRIPLLKAVVVVGYTATSKSGSRYQNH